MVSSQGQERAERTFWIRVSLNLPLVTCQVQGPRGRSVSMVSCCQPELSLARGDRGGGVCVRGKEERSSTNFESHPKILKLQPGVAAWAKAFFSFFFCAGDQPCGLKSLGLYLKIAAVHNFIFLSKNDFDQVLRMYSFFFFCASFFSPY